MCMTVPSSTFLICLSFVYDLLFGAVKKASTYMLLTCTKNSIVLVLEVAGKVKLPV